MGHSHRRQALLWIIRFPGNTSAWTQLYIAYNASDKVIERPLPEGDWEILVKDGRICDKAFCKDVVTVEPVSAVILGKRP